ncbi:MAG: toxin-antitoxin system YwqK family antitoxin [Bacteroidota bacterium]
MRKLFLIPLILFACSQSPELSEASLEGLASVPAQAKKEPYADNPNLVKVTVERAPGLPSEQGDYLNGQKHGTWTAYHNNDLVKSITTYLNGVKQGTHIEIDDRGQLLLKAYYHNGEYDGSYLAYKRTKVVERRFYKDGKLEGTLNKYYDNGNIMEESIYQNGKLNGVAKWYDQEGNVTLEYEYQDGQLIKK